MSVPPANRLRAIFWSALFALLFSGCGVFEVGIERTSTPLPPTEMAIPTATLTPAPVIGRLKPGQLVKIIQIRMLNRLSGWAICQVETDLTDHILFTLDGGQTWQDRTPAEALVGQPPDGQRAAAFFDADGNAWVTYSSLQPIITVAPVRGVWRTTDFGQTWQIGQAFDISGLDLEFFAISQLGFSDGQHGWALASLDPGSSQDYIAIFKTSDAGQTWQRVVDSQKNPVLMACSKTGLAFSTESIGWLTGDCPGVLNGMFLYTTSDKGQSWQPVTLEPPADQRPDFFSKGNPACGIPNLVYSSARALLLSVRCNAADPNKALAWLYISKDNGPLEGRRLPMPFGSLTFVSPDEGWMVGSPQNDLAAPGGIYHTQDGGRTWAMVIATAWQGRADFVDAEMGWVVAQSADKLALVTTQDGGVSWQVLQPVIRR